MNNILFKYWKKGPQLFPFDHDSHHCFDHYFRRSPAPSRRPRFLTTPFLSLSFPTLVCSSTRRLPQTTANHDMDLYHNTFKLARYTNSEVRIPHSPPLGWRAHPLDTLRSPEHTVWQRCRDSRHARTPQPLNQAQPPMHDLLFQD